jgi:manganese transport protein
MEVFIVSMVFIIGSSFLIEMFIVSPVYGDVLQGFFPSNLNGDALYIAIGIIGATVMPHNLYLHSSLVQTRKFNRSVPGMKNAIRMNFFDTTIALNLAFFVNAAILVLAAAAFYVNGYFHIAEIQDASKLLHHLFGNAAPTFFAIALIAAGQSSTITGTLAGQIVMEGHLNLRIQPWLRRLITRLLAIIPALITIIYFGDKALGSLLILSQVVLSLQLGFAVIPLIHFNSDKKQMKEFAIKTWVKVLAWLSASIIVYLNIHLVLDEIMGWVEAAGKYKILVYITVVPIAIASFAFLVFIFIHPFIPSIVKKRTQLPHGQAIEFADVDSIQYKNIAVAIDFSGNDQRIIKSALNQGGKSATYTFIHIVESAAAHYLGNDTMDYETQLDSNSLVKYQNILKDMGYKANIQIGFGKAAHEIAKIISVLDIDMLVMGVHGHKGFKDLIFGTTVSSIRHSLKIPLLIVN